MLSLINKILLNSPIINKVYRDNYALLYLRFISLNRKLKIIKTPGFVQWLSTYRCNLTCKHCEASSNEVRVAELTTAQISKAVIEMGKMGVGTFYATGGEPLLRDDIFEVIQLAKKHGMKVGIGTNSYLVDKYADAFRKAAFSIYFTSIDGLEETHDKFRGIKGSFKRVLKANRFMKELKAKIRMINTVFHAHNINEFDELFDIIRNSGATIWRISLLTPVGRGANDDSLRLDKARTLNLFLKIEAARKTFPVEISSEISYLGSWEKRVRSQPFLPVSGTYRCAIMPDGEVLASQLAYDNRYSEGNIKKDNFSKIWGNGFKSCRPPKLDDTCTACKYKNACYGGSWALGLLNQHCFKYLFDDQHV